MTKHGLFGLIAPEKRWMLEVEVNVCLQSESVIRNAYRLMNWSTNRRAPSPIDYVLFRVVNPLWGNTSEVEFTEFTHSRERAEVSLCHVTSLHGAHLNC